MDRARANSSSFNGDSASRARLLPEAVYQTPTNEERPGRPSGLAIRTFSILMWGLR